MGHPGFGELGQPGRVCTESGKIESPGKVEMEEGFDEEPVGSDAGWVGFSEWLDAGPVRQR